MAARQPPDSTLAAALRLTATSQRLERAQRLQRASLAEWSFAV
jgi:hypothetical protein